VEPGNREPAYTDKNMKIVLLRSSGNSHALRLSRNGFGAVLIAGFAAVALSVGVLIAQTSKDVVDDEVISQWRERLVSQQDEVDEIRSRSQAETQAVGRQLAQMQARLMRMEALGARVTEVADLDQGEFSFGEQVPQGGPSGVSQAALPWTDLRANLAELARGLKVRESELEVLESMLRDRDYRQAVAIAGRPVTWGWMSSSYGKRVDPFSGKMAWHAGVDFAGKDRSDVIAVASGVVTHAGKRYGYGEMVEINHGDGFVTRYGHHAEVVVATGDIVKKGQVIGKMGSSGRSTGPHVHYEVLKNGRHVDPARYVARR
jgi:murein DD-endopeptidase MepM/ murein hydrolase activator NlpD